MNVPPADPRQAASRSAHWRRTCRWTAALLLPWFGVGFVGVYCARDMRFSFLGWPFGFWMAGQGALLVFLVIVGVYASVMERIDRAHARRA